MDGSLTGLELYRRALGLLEEERPFALASVVWSAGSTPQKAGANAVFEAAGAVWGTLGGGCLEAESRRRALNALDTGVPDLFDLKLDDVRGWDDGLICGGRVRVFVDPVPSRNVGAWREALAARGERRRGWLATVVRHPVLEVGRSFWIGEADLPAIDWIRDPEPFHRSLLEGRALSAALGPEDAGGEVYVEPVRPDPRLIIAGGGHIGRAVAGLAAGVGFDVTVIDDRPLFADPARIPEARRVVCGDIAGEVAAQEIDADTFVLIVTRGHRHDGAVLAACVRRPAGFIGMIGSRRKSLLIRKSLVDEGLATDEEVARVVSPVGLEIGGESVGEIAISIVAQLVSARRRGALDGPSKNFRR